MERGEKTSFILRQFRKKSKRVINKDYFTEFFYLNRDRRVVEFLKQNDKLVVEEFFRQFLPEEFRNFVQVKILNDIEEEINTWFYEQETLVVLLKVNWGFKKQEISIDINIENFMITIIDENEQLIREIDYTLLNDHIISFLTLQARNLAQIFERIAAKKAK
jgi:hypothetical protein